MSFAAPVTVATVAVELNTSVHVFATGDFNGDGHADVLAGLLRVPLEDENDGVKLFLGNGTGALTAEDIAAAPNSGSGFIVTTGTVHPREIIVADFDGDGQDDAYIADHGFDSGTFPGHANVLLLSDGSTDLRYSPLPNVVDFSHSAAAADIDGDGDIDIYVGNIPGASSPSTSYFLINDGDGDFTRSDSRIPAVFADPSPVGKSYLTSELADIDNDGDPDLILGGWFRNTSSASSNSDSVILKNNGNGVFGNPITLPDKPFGDNEGQALDIDVADINRDGFQDILITYSDTTPFSVGRYIQFLIWDDEEGEFVDQTPALLTQTLNNALPWQIWTFLEDFDGDGDLDLAQAINQGSGFNLYLNDGSGNFEDTADAIGDFRFGIADLNGDGLPDLVHENGPVSDGSITIRTSLNTFGDGDDEHTGIELADRLVGAAGDDTLDGGEGNDSLLGGTGADSLVGGEGDDVLHVDNAGDDADGGNGIDWIRARVDLSLADYTDVENAALEGDADELGGSADNNILESNASANSTLIGSGGNDLYRVKNTGDSVVEAGGGGEDTVSAAATFTLGDEVEDLLLTGGDTISGNGNGGDNHVTGNNAANSLTGGNGADTLSGAGGNDILAGGDGDDAYVVLDQADSLIEVDGEGHDTVLANTSYSLPNQDIEDLVLVVTAFFGTGNTLGNVITGNGSINNLGGGAGDDTLEGGGGKDTMSGGADDDRFIVNLLQSGTKLVLEDTVIEVKDGGADTLVLVSGALALTTVPTLALAATLEGLDISGTGTANINLKGNTADNSLVGNAGNNILDGQKGVDALSGGDGNDTYLLDDAAELDLVLENDGEGTDTLVLGFSPLADISLDGDLASLENITLLKPAAVDLTGNAAANILIGNASANRIDGLAGADTMKGGGGNDTYVVDDENDRVTDSGGIDTVESSVSFTLEKGSEILVLTGDDLTGTGNTGANVLVSGGTDVELIGLGGNDTYAVYSTGITVTEQSNGGTDLVIASVDYTLGANVENLRAVDGDLDIDLAGNELKNLITGNEGDNVLAGGAGAGKDTLVGGLGADTFVIDRVTAKGIMVKDFSLAEGDVVGLANAEFGDLFAGTFADVFVLGAKALDLDDRLLYSAGNLFYDADGSDVGKAILIATLSSKPVLDATDFVLV